MYSSGISPSSKLYLFLNSSTEINSIFSIMFFSASSSVVIIISLSSAKLMSLSLTAPVGTSLHPTETAKTIKHIRILFIVLIITSLPFYYVPAFENHLHLMDFYYTLKMRLLFSYFFAA